MSMQNPYHPQQPYGAPAPSRLETGGGISQRTAHIMSRTKGWVRFLAVLFFVWGGLMLILALAAMATGSPEGMGAAFAYSLLGTLFFLIPGIKLNSYANRIGDLLRSGSAGDLERALHEHRGFWKFVGIMAIVFMVLYGLIILAAVARR